MNRWSKKGVLDRVFEQLQRDQIVRIGVEALGLDSTSVKVHPDGTGARRKTVRNVTTILQVPTCGMTLMRMPPRLGASCWRRSWGLAFPALFVAGVMMALDAVPDTSFFVPAAPTRDFSSGHIICM